MGGSSKKQTVGYKYYLGEHMILTHGPVDKLTRIEVDDRVVFSGSNTGTQVTLNSPNLFGGEKREGGISGAVDIEFGGPAQGRNDYLQARLGSSIPAFRGVVGIVLRQCYLGMSPYLKAWSFRLQRVNIRQDGLAQWYIDKAPIFSRAFSQLNLSFVLDGSGSMLETVSGSTTRWDIQEAEIHEALDAFKGVNLNLKIGVTIFGVEGSPSNLYRTINSPADIDALKQFISDFPITVPLGTYWADGMQGAKDFFNFAGPGEPVVIFTTDGNPTGNQTETDAAIAIRDTIPGIKVHVINIDLASLTYSNQLDNTGGADVVSSTGGGEIRDTALAAVGEFFEYNLNPAHIIRECLTDPDWGMGYQDADIDDVSFTACADTLYSEGMGMSLLWSRQNTIEEFVQEVVKHIDASLYVDRKTGLFVLKLVRDDYDENTIPVFDESNVSKVQNLSRASFGELVNSVTVNYWDAETGETASLTVQDTALVQMQNAAINTTIQYPGFTNAAIASRVAMRDLRALSAPLWSCTFYTGDDGEELNIGDTLKLSWSDYGLDSVVMRVTGLAFGNGSTSRVKVICTEDVYATPEEGTVSGPSPDDGWQPIDDTPAPATLRIVEESPYYELVTQFGQTEIDALLTDNPDLGYMFAAAGRPDSEGILNAFLYVDQGSGYEDEDTLDFSPYAYTDEIVSPTATTFAITGGVDLDTVTLGTHAQLGDELVRVDTVSATSVTVGRSVLDTVPKEHPQGTALVFWDNFPASDEVEYVASESINVKLLTASGAGVLAEASAPVDALTLDSRAIKPYPPGNFKVGGVAFDDVIDGLDALALSWAHRDRSQQTAGSFDDQTAGDIGPELGTTYTLRIYGENDTLGRTETGIATTSYTYDKTDEENDFLIPYDTGDFNYASFLSGANGEVWLATDLHYTDVARTTAAGVGDNVASLSGNVGNYNANQSTGAQQPTLQQASGKKYIDFDGSDDNLIAEGGNSAWNYFHNSTGPDAYLCCALRVSAASSNPGTAQAICGNNTVSSGQVGFCAFYDDRGAVGNNYARYFIGKGSSPPVLDLQIGPNAWTPQLDVIIEVIRQGSSLTYYLNGSLIGSGSLSSPTNSNATNPLYIGRSGGTFAWLEGWIYGLLLTDKIPDSAQRAEIQGDMSGRCISPPLPAGSGFRINGRLRVELESVRDGYTSRQHYDHEVLREGYGFNYGLFYGGEA